MIRHVLRSVLLASVPAMAQRTCDNLPHLDHPHATISNGEVSAVVFLPDADNGYYRSSRFDWSGVIACASFHGHRLWGEWFRSYDPLENDSITGPVEEFRPPEGAQGFDTTPPGGLFVKIGVGTLRRDSAQPYQFGHRYPIVDHGHWSTETHRSAISFRQQLNSASGVQYLYIKTILLDGSTVVLTHTLLNRGATPLRTDVYDHDFFVLDEKSIGPGFELQTPFAPMLGKPLDPIATVQDRRIIYRQPIPAGGTVDAYLTGYNPNAPADNHFTVVNTTSGFGVEQTGTQPLSKLYLWSIPSTICPEAYIHLDVAPGQTTTWTIRYRLFVNNSAR